MKLSAKGGRRRCRHRKRARRSRPSASSRSPPRPRTRQDRRAQTLTSASGQRTYDHAIREFVVRQPSRMARCSAPSTKRGVSGETACRRRCCGMWCASRAGIDKLAPHDLRRTCARLCHLAGGEPASGSGALRSSTEKAARSESQTRQVETFGGSPLVPPPVDTLDLGPCRFGNGRPPDRRLRLQLRGLEAVTARRRETRKTAALAV
jgi:hypothetical protein